MCGICGIINLDHHLVHEEPIRRMMGIMKHRGPDDEGVFVEENTGLGYVRLSILDLSQLGHQPMFDESERFVMIFNGEIYNYIEIREELISKGYSFKSKTDSEVLLKAYIHYGETVLDKLNGMFAFVIFDRKEKTLFGARDRFGIKPFYYFLDENKFIFASDIPPILSIIDKKNKTPNDSMIFDFLLFNRTNHTDQTFFNSVKKLQHSHLFNLKNGKMVIKKWYNLKEKVRQIPYNEVSLRKDLIDAIRIQLRSDVPVGACLSGGLDSSTIVSLSTKFLDRPDLHTFSAVYGDLLPGDESKFISEFHGSVKNNHITIPSSTSFFSEIDTFIEALSEPVPGTSEYAEFKVMQLAKDYCTVILNGQGVDEVLGGYHYFFGILFKELLCRYKWASFIKENYHYIKQHKSIEAQKYFFFFLLPPSLKGNRYLIHKNAINLQFAAEITKKGFSDLTEGIYNTKSLHDSFLMHFEQKFEHHLLWADKSGMWFSLETRFPFLDHNVIEKLLSLNNNQIISKGVTKVILRDAMRGVLPEKIRTRMDKVGYETPEDLWFREEFFVKFFLDLFKSKSFANRPYFDQRQVLRLFNKHQNKQINIGKNIWKWAHLELWLQKYID